MSLWELDVRNNLDLAASDLNLLQGDRVSMATVEAVSSLAQAKATIAVAQAIMHLAHVIGGQQ